MPAARIRPVIHSSACRSGKLLVRVAPRDVGLFRFLLEARDNLALFTVLDNREALLKLLFSPHQENEVLDALGAMRESVNMEISPWPW